MEQPAGTVVQTDQQFTEAIQFLTKSRLIVLDLETLPFGTEENPTHPPMCGVASYSRVRYEGGFHERGYYFPFRHNPHQSFEQTHQNLDDDVKFLLFQELQRDTKTLVGHNLPYDFTCLMEHDGWDYPRFMWYDTMYGAHLLDENRFSFRLEAISQDLFNDEGAIKRSNAVHKMAATFGGMHKLPIDLVGSYAVGDVWRTFRIYSEWVRPKLEKENLLDLWWPGEAEYNLELAQISRRGILIDQAKARLLAAEAEQNMRLIRDTLGFDPAKPSVLAIKLFAAPPKGLGLPIQRLSRNNQSPPFITPDGRRITKCPAMDKQILESFIDESPLVESVLRYRTYQKAYSTWFQGWLELVGSDGRIHPGFKRHGTVTGRLSSEKPNVQQLPRRSDDPTEEAKYIKHRVKEMLCAPPGYNLWEFDYSQIEYRLAACYGNDKAVLDGLNNGQDFHQLTANTLGIPRHDAKTLNFAILYGAGKTKLAMMLGISEEEAGNIIGSIRASMPGLYRAILSSTYVATTEGQIKLWTGRTRHLPGSNDAHKAFNSAVQGGAAEIVRYTIVKLSKEKSECPIVSQVHDALWLEVPHEDEEKHLDEIQEIMEWPGGHFPIIFPVERKMLAQGPMLKNNGKDERNSLHLIQDQKSAGVSST